jgi:hypothetical protein
MHTLFDFISDVSAMQYALALLFVLGFIIFYEILKPRPFEGLLKSAAEDIRFIRTQEKKNIVQFIKKIALAPVYALFYLVAVPIMFYIAAVPILFVRGMSISLGRMFTAVASAEWSPVRAYFTGHRKAKKAKVGNAGQQDSG